MDNRYSSKTCFFIILLITCFCTNHLMLAQTITDNSDAQAWEDNPWGITVTRDPQNTPLISYENWQSSHPASHSLTTKLQKSKDNINKSHAAGIMDVIVNEDIYDAISSALDQYINDLSSEGFTANIVTSSGGTPEELRLYLQSRYVEGLTGAILIGDLPIAWHETDCWDPVENEQFPCDYYYMDLTGTWEDTDEDGLTDLHWGSILPEIWIGRLTASPNTYNGANEVSLLLNYFDKNHRYRTGQLIFPDKGLAYIDDDWSTSGWENDLGIAYADVTAVTDDYTTTASNYTIRLEERYESILLCAHSGPRVHAFKSPPENWSYMYYDDIVNIDPEAAFYNMFNCSGARFTEENYLAGWYIFSQSFGLAAVGSTKTGSMLQFENFYTPFSQGKSFGESFKEWFSDMASDGMANWEICWYYGMTLCGDPTLVRHPFSGPEIITQSITSGLCHDYYSCIFEAQQGIPPYNWEITWGIIPDGISLNPQTGVLSGITSEIGTFQFAIEAKDSSSPQHADTAYFQLEINYICGDASGDLQLNVGDAVFLINNVFKGGPFPIPSQAGDANCSNGPEVGDAVYIINHVFKDGPYPCCPQ